MNQFLKLDEKDSVRDGLNVFLQLFIFCFKGKQLPVFNPLDFLKSSAYHFGVE